MKIHEFLPSDRLLLQFLCLIPKIITIAHVHQNAAELSRRKYRFIGTRLTACVNKCDATSLHQRGAKPFALLKHRLIGAANESLILSTLAVYRLPLPPYNLVSLPRSDAHLPSIAAPHTAYLPLFVKFLSLQRLQETLHTAAYHSVETETVAAHVAKYIGWVQTIGTYIQRICFRIIHILQFVPIPCGSHIIIFHFVPLFYLS